jgi:hypothetical protein
VEVITGHCPLNKHLNIMGLIDLAGWKMWLPSLITLRMHTFSKPILGVEEYVGHVGVFASAVADSL